MATPGVEGPIRCPATVWLQAARGAGYGADLFIRGALVKQVGQHRAVALVASPVNSTARTSPVAVSIASMRRIREQSSGLLPRRLTLRYWRWRCVPCLRVWGGPENDPGDRFLAIGHSLRRTYAAALQPRFLLTPRNVIPFRHALNQWRLHGSMSTSRFSGRRPHGGSISAP